MLQEGTKLLVLDSNELESTVLKHVLSLIALLLRVFSKLICIVAPLTL